MFSDKFVFAQLASFLNRNHFNYLVRKYNDDRYVKYLTCWNQFLAMMFGQLANRESLRDLIVALDAHRSKCYHLGLGKNISKSSLARTNQDRDYRIFEEFAFYLVSEARKRYYNDIFELGGNVYAFDSTTINLCLSVFWWAKFRKKKGGVKVQIYIAISTYLLVSIVKHDMQLDRSIYEILQILSISLTDKTHLKDLFDKTKFQYDKELLGFNGPVLFNV